MRKSKKFLALGLTLTLMLTALAGCGSKDSSGQPSEGEQTSSGAEASSDSTDAAADDDGGVSSSDNTIVVGMMMGSRVDPDYKNNAQTRYIEESLGVNLEFQYLPIDQGDAKTTVNTMAISASMGDTSELPDVFVMEGLGEADVLEYGEAGFFLPLDEYLADPEKMPNYNAIPAEDRAEMESSARVGNGHIYGLVDYAPEAWNVTPFRMYINKAWLDQLGLEIPTTTDELKDVLIAFRDNDPNGNGQKDELGVYGFTAGGYGEKVPMALMNSFVFWNERNGGLALDESGNTVIAPFITDEFREGIRYLNDLCKEGLMPDTVFTDTGDTYKAQLNAEDPVVGFTSCGSLGNWPDAATNPNFLQMEMVPPMIGPEGVQYTVWNTLTYGVGELFIPANTANDPAKLDLVLKFSDFFFDHDLSVTARYGEKDVDWTEDPAVLAEHTNAYVEAGLYDSLSMVSLNNIWTAEAQNKDWQAIGPAYRSMDYGATIFDFSSGNKFNPEDKSQVHGKSYEYYYDRHPEYMLPQLKYTDEETQNISEAISDITSHVWSAMGEFVNGTRDINSDADWQTYLDEIDNYGLQKWLETAQTAYERVK